MHVLPCGSVTNPPAAMPTATPTIAPTDVPTIEPTAGPTETPTPEPTAEPTPDVTLEPTTVPTATPTPQPGEGQLKITLSSTTIYVGDHFTTQVSFDTGDKSIKEFSITLNYPSNSIKLDISIGNKGVVPAPNINITILNAIRNALDIYATSDLPPGPDVLLFTINWTAVAESTSTISVSPLYFIDQNGYALGKLYSATIQAAILQTVTPDPAGFSLKAMYRCGQPEPALNHFDPNITVVNTGIDDIPLDAITFRYYYTKEGDSEEVATVLASGAIPANVITTIHQDYLEVGFAPDSGVLHPQNGNEGEVCLEVHKLDWSGYDQSDDWSFEPTKIVYTDWDHITVYYNGILKWGSVLPPPTPEPTAEPTAEPTNVPPEPPTNLKALPNVNGIIRLVWNDNSQNEAGFRLERKFGNDIAYIDINSPDTISYFDRNLGLGETYTYRVCAYNECGESAYSSEVTVTTINLRLPDNLNGIRYELTFQNDGGMEDRWIANNGTLCRPFTITVVGSNDGEDTVALFENTGIKIMPPIDPYYNDDDAKADPDKDNVKRNKGDCWYRLYATGQDRLITNVWLAEFNRGDSANFSVDADDFFGTKYNGAFFDVNGRTNQNCSLVIDGDGTLRFTDNGTSYEWFSVAVVNGTGDIRPGDDMLLKFRLAEDELFRAYDPNPIDFLAVTDFPLLWRANLYINEGVNDWNNLNRWTYAQGNEWDKDWEDADNDGIIDEAGPYNGGQCVIRPWTSIYTYFNMNNGPLQVNNSVAYSLGCDDTPYFFNQYLVEEKNAIQAYYARANDNDPNNDAPVAPNPAPGLHIGWENWNDTLAPEGEWGNYIYADPSVVTTAYTIAASNGTIYYPYAPGFSSFRLLNGDNPDYYFDHTKYSAGVECQGFIARAAGYNGNTYILDSEPDTERTTWSHTTGAGININNWPNLGWQITNINTDQTSFVIPGDVITMNGHVGIVSKVVYSNNRIAGVNDITFIDASGIPMCVRNDKDWNYFIDFVTRNYANPFCNIIRLITQ